MFRSFAAWVRKVRSQISMGGGRKQRHRSLAGAFCQPRVEDLEDRLAPSVVTNPDFYSAVPNQSFAAASVLGNDEPPAGLNVSEVNGQAATIGQPLLLPSGTTVQFYAGGYFTFWPAPSSMADGFSYTATDGTDSATTTVSITFDSPPPPPPPPSLPIISITPLDTSATEGEQDNASFVVARTGQTSNQLTITLSFSGTATMEGTSLTAAGDYGLLVDDGYVGSSVTFQPGQSAVSVTLLGYDDDQVEAAEQAVLTIADSTNGTYLTGAAKTVAVNIVDATAWTDGTKAKKHVPILLERLRVNVRDNDQAHKVMSTLMLQANKEYKFAVNGTAKIGLNPDDDVDAEWAKWNETGGPYSFLDTENHGANAAGAGYTNVGLRSDDLWWSNSSSNVDMWGYGKDAEHAYQHAFKKSINYQPSFYFLDYPGQYADNSGTLTVEIGQRAPFGTMPAQVGGNPADPAATATNLTVAIVTGSPQERTDWSASARAYNLIGNSAYIYNTITNLQDLANALSIFPNGSIGTLVFGGHGVSGDIGVQIANSGTFAPDGTTGQDLSYTNLQTLHDNNANGFHAIADKLASGGTLRVESCGTNSAGRTANAFALASLLCDDVAYSDGTVTGWGVSQGTWVTMCPT